MKQIKQPRAHSALWVATAAAALMTAFGAHADTITAKDDMALMRLRHASGATATVKLRPISAEDEYTLEEEAPESVLETLESIETSINDIQETEEFNPIGPIVTQGAPTVIEPAVMQEAAVAEPEYIEPQFEVVTPASIVYNTEPVDLQPIVNENFSENVVEEAHYITYAQPAQTEVQEPAYETVTLETKTSITCEEVWEIIGIGPDGVLTSQTVSYVDNSGNKVSDPAALSVAAASGTQAYGAGTQQVVGGTYAINGDSSSYGQGLYEAPTVVSAANTASGYTTTASAQQGAVGYVSEQAGYVETAYGTARLVGNGYSTRANENGENILISPAGQIAATGFGNECLPNTSVTVTEETLFSTSQGVAASGAGGGEYVTAAAPSGGGFFGGFAPGVSLGGGGSTVVVNAASSSSSSSGGTSSGHTSSGMTTSSSSSSSSGGGSSNGGSSTGGGSSNGGSSTGGGSSNGGSSTGGTPVPEPAPMLIFGLLGGLAALRKRNRIKS